MGGSYEDEVQVAPPKGKTDDTNEVTVKGIRFHESKGHVHFHDDKAGLKCYVPKAVWWKEWNRIRMPVAEDQGWAQFHDLDNESYLTVATEAKGDSVGVAIQLSRFTPPKTFDRVWHALDNFTNRSASGS